MFADLELPSALLKHTQSNPNIGQYTPNRRLFGMTNCKKNCLIFPYVLEGKDVKSKHFKWRIETDVSCETTNIVYMLICMKENFQSKEGYIHRYIGESERTLKDRVCELLGYINTKRTDQPERNHFNMRGHSKSDMRVVILERVFKQDPAYRKERESHLIRKFNTFYKGMNQKP